MTVAEITYSNSISVSEHVVMMILSLVRNYIPSYRWVVDGGWNIADCVARSYDVEGMTVGTVGAGRIGTAVLRRLKPFEVQLSYADRHRLPAELEQELGLTFYATAAEMVPHCDVVTINTPLYPDTEHLFDDALLATMKRGAYIVNTARGKICDRDAIVRALDERPARRVRRRCLVPAAAGEGPPVATHAAPRHDAAHLGVVTVRPGALRRGRTGDSGVLDGEPADPRRVPDRRGRSPRWRRRARLRCWRRDPRVGGGRRLGPGELFRSGTRMFRQ